MDKIKNRGLSLKCTFMIYLCVCGVLVFAGAFGIGFGTNYLQEIYREQYMDDHTGDPRYQIYTNSDVDVFYDFNTLKYDKMYSFISNAQFVLIPMWVVLCVSATGVVFFNREMKKPIDILENASRKIAENDLDFTVECYKNNELGKLCGSFEEMRSQLYKNNLEMWRSAEERRRINSAFAHDLRTPLTVLKGYSEMLKKYIPDGKLSKEKLCEIADMMEGQINRLERYTKDMSALQKLDDIVPMYEKTSCCELEKNLVESGRLICAEKTFTLGFDSDGDFVFCDNELLFRVFENLVSNAARYAETEIKAELKCSENHIVLTVSDDGKGFSDEALRSAAEPFFRDEKEQDKTHFGLGLYICRIICEKCGGGLEISNGEKGGKVTSEFFSKSR